MQKKCLIFALMALITLPSFYALEFNLKDGSSINGKIASNISFKTPYGTLILPGDNIEGIDVGDKTKIVMIDGSVFFGTIMEQTLQVNWKYGTIDMEVANIVFVDGASSIGSTAAATKAAKTYEIGDRGPAGGVVFYDKGEHGDGWRYLEAAPSGWYDGGEDPKVIWSNDRTLLGAKTTKIGTGKSNTKKIADYLRYGESGRAVQLCDELEYGGYNDWFLPSKDELSMLYRRRAIIGGFVGDDYWSSSEYNSNLVWIQTFVNGNQNAYVKFNANGRVRAIRAF